MGKSRGFLKHLYSALKLGGIKEITYPVSSAARKR